MAKDYSALKKQFLESTKDFEEKLMLAKSNIIRSTIYVTDTQDKLTDEATLDTIRNQIIANKKIANINISLDSISLVVSRYSQKVDNIENVYAREYLNNFSKSGQLNRWTPGGATLVSDNIKGYALKLTTAGRMEAYSDMFEVSPTNTFKISFSLNNPNINNAGTVALKVFAYDKNKNAVSCKVISATAIIDSTSPELFNTKATTNNTFQTFSGYIYGCNTDVDVNVPKGEMAYACKLGESVRYLSIRLVLNCTEPLGDGNSHSIYIADPFIGDIDNSIVSINKQLSEAFIKLEPGNIQQVVKETTYTKEEVNSKVTTVDNKVSDVNNKVDNIQIGGRNFLRDTSKDLKTVTFSGWDNYLQTLKLSDLGFRAGDILTGRVYLKPSNYEVSIHLDFRNEGETSYIQKFGNNIQPNTEGYSTITATIPDKAPNGEPITKVKFSIRHSSGTTPSNTVGYKEAKLEKGNRATDWTPALEDIDKNISDVNTKSEQALSSLSDLANDNKLTPNEKQSSAKEWNIIDVQYARICEDASKIGVSTSDLTTKHHSLRDYLSPLFANMTITSDINGTDFKNKFKDYYNSQQITLNALSIKAKEVADGVQNNLDNLQIGGRNIQLNSAPTTNVGWSWAGTAGTATLVDEPTAPRGKAMKATFTVSGSSGGMHKPPKERLKVGAIYSWSIWLKASKEMIINLGCEQGGSKEFTIGTEWQRVTHTFTATDRLSQSFVMYVKNAVVGDYYLVHSLKVESGTLSTDWTIAPEDYDAEIADANKKGQDALNSLTDLANDNKLTPNEKQQTKKDWDIIVGEYPKILSEATKSNIATTSYTNAYNTLKSYIEPILSNLTTTTDITGATFRTNFKTYYDTRQDTLNAISSALKSSADNANNKIDNLQIGARNIIRNSRNPQNKDFWTCTPAVLELIDSNYFGQTEKFFSIVNTTTAERVAGTQRYKLEGGSTYTVSMIVNLETNVTSLDVWLLMKIDGSTATDYDVARQLISGYNTVKNKFHVVTGTITIPENIVEGYVRVDNNGGGATANRLWFSAVKLEKGSRATDWTPALEDVDKDISDANKKGQDALNSLTDLASDNKLTPNEKQQAKKEWDVIAVEKPKLEAEAVKYGVDKTNYNATYNVLVNYLNPLFSNMTTTSDIVGNTFRDNFKNYYTAKQDLLNAISLALKTSADNANNKIDNLQVGGTNLISDNRDVIKGTVAVPTYDALTHTWTITATNGEGSTWGAGLRIGSNKVIAPYGATFIVSFEIKVPVACEWNVDVNTYPTEGTAWAGNDNDNISFRKTSSKSLVPGKWIKCWYSFVNNDSRNTLYSDIYDNSTFGVRNSTGSSMTYNLRNIKGELGTVPTDWSPCPYDIQSQINATNKVVETQTSKVSKIETSLGQISSKVETLETTEVKTRKVSSFRYLRDWLNGSTANGGNHTCEIQVWVGDTNIAQGKTPTSNTSIVDPQKCTDGVIDSTYTQFGSNAWCYLQIDLGSDRTDVDMIKLWHYYADGRAYNHKLEVSRDGVTWYELFNSDKSGKYSESSKGRTYIINESYTETRLKTAEQKITDDAITSTVAKKFYTKDDIEGKGYQNSSQVQQTVDKLEVKFTESGGYNLLYNSAFANNQYEFWQYVNGAEPWGDQSYYKNVGDMFIKNATSGNAHFGQVGDIPVKPNVKYSVSLSASREGNVKGGSVYLDCYNNGTYVTTLRQQLIFDSKRHTYLFTFASNVTHVRFYIEHSGSTSTSGGFLIQINKPCFTEGEIPVWSPHPSELCDGIITANRDGIIVRNSDADTYTRINAESFAVNDSRNGTIAEFGRSSLIPNLNCPGTLTAGHIYANNACSKTTEYKTNTRTLYVQGVFGNDNNDGSGWGSASALRTVGEAIRRLPDIINQHTYIYIGGSVSGFEFSGRWGCGTITFTFEDDCVVNSNIVFDGIGSKVVVRGNDSKKGTLQKEIYACRCSYIHIHHLTFRGGDGGANVYLQEGTNAVVEMNDMGHTWCAIAIGAGCNVAVRNNQGSELDWYVACGMFSRTYFKSQQADYIPDSKFGMTTGNGDDGTAYVHQGANVNWIKKPSEGWNPSYTPTQRVTAWNFNSIWSDETLNGWSNVNELVQGYYSGWSTGRWTGYMQMTDGMSDIRNVISGGTNLSGRLYVQRRTSSGNATGSLLCLYGSDGTLITNNTRIDRGQGVWVSLSSSIIQKIQSGAITYFYLKADANNSNTYFKCESNAKIEITYTK